MYGIEVDKLKVFKNLDINNPVYTLSGNKGRQWLKAELELQLTPLDKASDIRIHIMKSL